MKCATRKVKCVMRKTGVSLITVLLLMLVATIAATATYKWITSEGRSSASRLRQSEAYQSAVAGIENTRSWMTFHANDVGALIRQYMNGETSDTTLARNAAPQENMKLPLAQDVPGLADYFYSFVDEPAPEFPQDRDFGLAFDRRTASYNLTSGYQTFVSYKITWDKRFGDDAIYTLISAKEGEDYMPIRTIHPGEEAAAWIGCVTQDQGTRVQIYDDGLTSGSRTFLVTAILPDGRFCVSEPVTRSF